MCNFLAACKSRATHEILSRVPASLHNLEYFFTLSYTLPLHDSHLNIGLLIAKIQPNLAQNKANNMVDKIQPYNINKTGISFSPFCLLDVLIPLSLSSKPLRIYFLQCVKFIAIRSYVSLNSTMVAEVLNLRTSLRLWKRLPFSLGFGNKWILRFC